MLAAARCGKLAALELPVLHTVSSAPSTPGQPEYCKDAFLGPVLQHSGQCRGTRRFPRLQLERESTPFLAGHSVLQTH